MKKTVLFAAALACCTPAWAAPDMLMVPVTTSEDQKAEDGPQAVKSFNDLVGTSIGVEAFASPITSSPTVVTKAATISCPTGMAGLTDGFDMFSYSLDQKAAAELSLYGSASMKIGDRVVLYQWMWYKDIQGPDGKTIGRCGSGVSLALKVGSFAGSFSTSLPFLAASAQLDQAEIEYRLYTFGMSGASVNAAFPTASLVGNFDAQSYAELLRSIDRLQSAGAAGKGVTFTPRIVSVATDSPRIDISTQGAAIAYSVLQISRGQKCSAAKAAISATQGASVGLVEDVYRNLMGAEACKSDAVPDAAAIARAKKLAEDFHLKWSN